MRLRQLFLSLPLLAQTSLADDGSLKQRRYSVMMPVHPKQLEIFASAMATWRSHFLSKDDAAFEEFLVSTPCLHEWSTQRIARGEFIPSTKALDPLRESTIEYIYTNEGRIDRFAPEGVGLREKYADFIPRHKWKHMCDDWLICGEVRCKFRFRDKSRRPTGWCLQQLVKLGASRFISSTNYFVIDAEVYVASSFSTSDLFDRRGASIAPSRCCLGWKCAKPDSPPTISNLVLRWGRAFNHSLVALGVKDSIYDIKIPEDACVLGVTPQTLRTSVVRDILELIEVNAGPLRPWWIQLTTSRFTEFALYNTYMLLHWDSVGRVAHNFSVDSTSTSISGSRFKDLVVTIPDEIERHRLVRERADGYIREICNREGRIAPYTFLVCHEEATLTPDECAGYAARLGSLCREASAFLTRK